MINRTSESAIKENLRYFPIAPITGPRQSGKTTPICNMIPNLPYFSLEIHNPKQPIIQ